MSDTLLTAIAKTIAIIVIFGLAWLMAWSGSESIWWLFYTIFAIFGLMLIGVIFLCIFLAEERNR